MNPRVQTRGLDQAGRLMDMSRFEFGAGGFLSMRRVMWSNKVNGTGRRRFLVLFGLALAVVTNAVGEEPGSQGLTASSKSSSPRNDREALLDVLQHNSDLLHRYSGDKTFLDEVGGPSPQKTEFRRRLEAIAKRLDMETPDILIANPTVDDHGNPKPQKPDSSIGWANNVNGEHHNIIFVTKYLRDNLTDEQLLAVLAHEMGHFPQYKKNGGQETHHGRKMEAEADAFALSCPEVDPNDFKSMLIQVEKLQDEAARKHPLLYNDFTGSTKLIPISVQTKMLFGGAHPMIKTRIGEADKEILRRAALTAKAVRSP
jgi:Zn-dependent protease with chaperone function